MRKGQWLDATDCPAPDGQQAGGSLDGAVIQFRSLGWEAPAGVVHAENFMDSIGKTLARCEPIFWLSSLIGLTALTLTLFWMPRSVSVVELAASSFESAVRSGPASKDEYLSRVSHGELRRVASHTHFIGELIRKTSSQAPQASELAMTIVVESIKAGYDPLLVAAVIKSESTFDDSAVSHKGAHGLMQIQPETGKYISSKNGVEWAGRQALKDPKYNLKLGIAYLKYLERTFNGNRRLALIAYNWGPANLSAALKNGAAIPSTSVNFARKILERHEQWRLDLEARMASYKHMDLETMLS